MHKIHIHMCTFFFECELLSLCISFFFLHSINNNSIYIKKLLFCLNHIKNKIDKRLGRNLKESEREEKREDTLIKVFTYNKKMLDLKNKIERERECFF